MTNSQTEHFESFYHCLHCRQVFYLEETDRKVRHRCPNCGPGTFFKIEDEKHEGDSPPGAAQMAEWMEDLKR